MIQLNKFGRVFLGNYFCKNKIFEAKKSLSRGVKEWLNITYMLTLFEEDKNKARRALSDGPNGSISIGRRKGKPIPCIGPLRIEHYIK